MHPQLSILMELQDLRAQLRELSRGGESKSLEEEHFHIDPAEARERLAAKISEIEDSLDEPVKSRYQRISPNRERVVVPVISGICYGCFVSIPTATAGEQDIHEQIQSCQNCGCFIYILS